MSRIADISVSIILIIISVLTISVASSFPDLEGVDVGPAFFPRMLSYILIGLSVILLFKGLRIKKEGSTKAESITWKAPTLGIAVTIIYTLAFKYIGFYPATFIFLLVMMWMFGFRKKILVLILSLGITFCIYLLFELLLQVPIPVGTLFE